MNNCSFLWVKLSVVENIKSFNAHQGGLPVPDFLIIRILEGES